MTTAVDPPAIRRVVGVALNAAIDKTVSVDRLVAGAIHRPVIRSVVAGGKAANVVRAARHMGLDGTMVAVLGGHAGAWYRAQLEERSIALHEVSAADETRTCLSVLDDTTGELTEFYEAGIRLRDEDWPVVEAALRAAIGGDGSDVVVVLAGSLPPGTPADAYARLAVITAERGARAVVDSDGASMAAALATRPWLVKVNAAEAETVTGTSARTRDRAATAAAELRSRGAANAIVTRGVHGAAVATADGSWALGNLPAAHRGPYSVGSGDAFLAGFLAGSSRGLGPADALRVAGATGAANARTPGQGELDPADVDRTRLVCEVVALPART
ncbi:MAG TPA: hexose kinase [Candidatus Limnocylindrales bacterium]